MERLTEKIEDRYIARQERLSNGKIVGDKMCLNKLGMLENLEEQGLLLILPCKVGDELFVKHRTFKGEIVKGVCIGYTWWRTDGFCIMFHSETPSYEKVDIAFSKFGKTVFLTKEEAEAALKKLSEAE